MEGPSAAVCRQTRKSGEMGRKIATKETQEGCLSFSINRFPELFKVLENASSLSKRLFRQAEAGIHRMPAFRQFPVSREILLNMARMSSMEVAAFSAPARSSTTWPRFIIRIRSPYSTA